MWHTVLTVGLKLVGGLLVAGIVLGVSLPLAPDRMAMWGVWFVALLAVAAVFALTRRE